MEGKRPDSWTVEAASQPVSPVAFSVAVIAFVMQVPGLAVPLLRNLCVPSPLP
jgi:hypothetical protein